MVYVKMCASRANTKGLIYQQTQFFVKKSGGQKMFIKFYEGKGLVCGW